MKKLKIILPLFLFMMLLAFVVNAENCDTDKISISSITLKDKSDNVTEGNKASVNDKNIKLDLNMLKLGANVEYEIVVNNESDADYELDKSSFNFNSDYVYYSISSNDESNIVKANSTKTINLKVEYKNEVPDEAVETGVYNDNQNMKVQLLTGDIVDIPNTSKYSKLGGITHTLILLIMLIALVTTYLLIRNTKYNKLMILVIGTAFIIPIGVCAVCKCEISIDSSVKILKPKVQYWTYDSEVGDFGVYYQTANFKYTEKNLNEIPKPYYVKTILTPTIAGNDIYEIQYQYIGDDGTEKTAHSSYEGILYNSLTECNDAVESDYSWATNPKCAIMAKSGELYDSLKHEGCLKYNGNSICIPAYNGIWDEMNNYKTQFENKGLICGFSTVTSSVFYHHWTNDINSANMLVCTTNQEACFDDTRACEDSWVLGYDQGYDYLQLEIARNDSQMWVDTGFSKVNDRQYFCYSTNKWAYCHSKT